MSELTARIAGSASEIAETIWDSLANPTGRTLPHPFTRHAFFHALEQSGSAAKETGWEPMHLVIEQADEGHGKKPANVMSRSPMKLWGSPRGAVKGSSKARSTACRFASSRATLL